jgi:hypothetical protein
MKPIEAIKKILSGLYLSLKRFPLTILLSASVACILIAISETNPAEDTLAQIAMALSLGIPLSLSIKLFFERGTAKNNFKLLAGYIVGAVILVLYYFYLLDDFQMVEVTRYIAVSLALYLTFIYIPYFPRKQRFEAYVITLFTGFFTTVIYSAVLYSGLSAILFAVDKLLGVRIQGEIHFYTFLFVVFLFAVTYFLAGIPLKSEEPSEKSYPKLLKILLLYIIMPLISAYTIILYIYFAKILITWQWPINIVTNLVLWYSVIAIIVLFFITPIKLENKWASSFLKLFPKIILPVLAMMFISISIRINAYGVTERRYFVIVLALWVFAVMIYLSFTKKLRNIIIPVSLALIALVSVFGPVSSYSVSKQSQNKRFENILVKNNMLKDGKIEASSDISKKDKADISSILTYFDNNHNINDIKYLPENFKIDNMENTFGFAYEGLAYGEGNYFYLNREQTERAIDVRGYDYYINNIIAGSIKNTNENALNVIYNYESTVIKIKYEGKEIYIKDFNSFIQKLADKYPGEAKNNNPSTEEMTFTDENEKLKVKFIFNNISGSRDGSNESKSVKGLDFNILIKIK